MRTTIKYAILIMMLALLCGCADRTIKDTDMTSSETSTADIQKPEKHLVGEIMEGNTSLYDASLVYEKEGYQILDMHGYGDNGILVLYSGLTDSVLSLYSVANATEIKNIRMEDVMFVGDSTLRVSASNMVYAYDESNRLFCYFDMEQAKYNVIQIDFEAHSMYVDNTGKIIYYTKKDDGVLYQYVLETGKSQTVCDLTDISDNIRVINIESKTGHVIVEVIKGEQTQYAAVDISTGKAEVLNDTEGALHCIGEVYVTVPHSEEVYINVYNREKPRIIEKFYLEREEELDNMKLYSGNPYLLTIIDTDAGSELRFYSLSRGIMINKVVLPKNYIIKDATYLQMGQTLCIETTDSEGEKGLIFWDLEADKQNN